jgi:hypothetical protein
MAAGLGALDHQRIGAGPHQLLRHGQGGGEADHLGATLLRPADGRGGRDAAGEDDMRHLRRQAGLHQLLQPRMHGDEVDAEGPVGQRLGPGDLRRQPVGLHGAAGDGAEGPGIGQSGDQVPLAHPAHRTAHDGDAAAEEAGATRHEAVEQPGLGGGVHQAPRGSACGPSRP